MNLAENTQFQHAPDWSLVAHDYQQHRAGFPDRFFDRLAQHIGPLRDRNVVDLATGTGTIALGLAARGARVTAIDLAPGQVRAAQELARQRGMDTIDWRVGRAEDTGLPMNAFDLVIAGQAWHWFDRARTAAEAQRLLGDRGWLAIAHLDFLASASEVVARTMALVHRFRDPDAHFGPDVFGVQGFYPRWLDDCRAAGFVDLESLSFDVDIAYSHTAWRGRMRASAWIGATLPEPEIRAFDAALHQLLLDLKAPDPIHIPHRVFLVLARKAVA